MSQCVKQWKQLEIIWGVMKNNNNNSIIMEGFKDNDALFYEPRIIKRKKNYIVETFCRIVIKFSAYELHKI